MASPQQMKSRVIDLRFFVIYIVESFYAITQEAG